MTKFPVFSLLNREFGQRGPRVAGTHHDEQHRIGADAFGDKYGVDLWGLAAEFGRKSPDWEMRASLRIVTPALISSSPDPR